MPLRPAAPNCGRPSLTPIQADDRIDHAVIARIQMREALRSADAALATTA